MKSKLVSWRFLAFVGWSICSWSQVHGTPFVNLGFESASLSVIPAGEPGELVSISDALPGWAVLLGDDAQTQVWHNSLALGSSQAGIIGPDFGFGIIEGSFSAVMQAGTDAIGTPLEVSLSQFGTVPQDALSLRFKSIGDDTVVGGLNPFVVTLGGQSVPMIPITSSSSEYTLYAGDISMLSGEDAELKLTALPFTEFGYTFFLDSIEFSSQPIPEPSTWVMLGVGTLIVGWRLRRIKRK